MAFTYTTVALLQKDIIANLDNQTVIRPFANRKYEGQLKQQGDTVTVQSLGDVTWNRGGTAGTAITAGTLAVTNYSLTVNECDQINVPFKDIDQVQYNRELQGDLAQRVSVGLAQIMDKYTAQLAVTSATTKNTTALTMSASNAYATAARLTTDLEKLNITEGVALFVSPEVKNFMKQATEWSNTDLGVGIRRNGLTGEISSAKIYTSNNMPHVRVLTAATIATAGDTMTINGVVFTFRAAAGATTAGDISIGANAAAMQQNIIDAINGTGTAGASTYVAISAANRLILKNAFVKSATSWVSDTLRIYSGSALTVSETFTPAGDVFAADATVIFACDSEAINVVDQMTKMDSRDVQDAFATNFIGEYVYGGAVLGRNANRIATYDIANG